MKVIHTAALVALCSSCTAYHLDSVRPTFAVDPGKLEISCATFPATDETEINSRLAQLYDSGWRLAATGGQRGFAQTLFLCFERPARPHAKSRPPPPPVDDSEGAEEAPPPVKKKASAAAPPPDAPAAEDNGGDASGEPPAPPPKKKKHNPLMDDQ
jgi:hypothetical protein